MRKVNQPTTKSMLLELISNSFESTICFNFWPEIEALFLFYRYGIFQFKKLK